MFQFLRILLAGNLSNVSGVARAVAQFERFENDLQHDFFALAAKSGNPRGFRWASCEWLQELLIVADQDSQLISAFVSVALEFESAEDGDTEGISVVSTIHDGSAVFHFNEGGWGSTGRVVFNLSPAQAADRLIPEAVTVFHRGHVA